MPKTKVAVSVESELSDGLDALVEATTAGALKRVHRTPLAGARRALDVSEERVMTESGLVANAEERPDRCVARIRRGEMR